VASFVALLEVVAGVGFAWLLVDQLPGVSQLAGGLLIIAGVCWSNWPTVPPDRPA
jgi:drug/metabolite transporter (DMT)-like permease